VSNRGLIEALPEDWEKETSFDEVESAEVREDHGGGKGGTGGGGKG